ncbi:MAG: beta-ketoacyl synthase N-terminal-like domain-containing protein, partial [Pseudomonadota bacterium]
GYLNLPDETAARFVPDPFQTPPARMFRTGDIGRALPDGQLEITGRAKFMVKLRGYTIVPSAVEAAITSHHEIAAAAVVAIDDPHMGQPERLVAYVAGQSGQPGSSVLRDLRAHLQSRLPAYAIPSEFIPLAELPIAETTGKVDRKRLPPPTAGPQLREAHSAPPTPDRRRTEVTAKLCEIWTDVLGRTPAVGDDNFFDLGGHSLLAIDVVRRTEAAFAVTLNVIDVFDYPTLDSFSRHVASRMAPVSTAHARRRPGRLRPDASASADIAVVEMACRFPGANTPEALWANLRAGTESIRQFTDDELRAFGVPGELIGDPNYVKAGALLEDVASFDPAFFSLSMREATLMDPQHRLFIECCWEAMERSGHAPGRADGRVGVFAGCYLPGYLVHHLGAAQHLDPADPTRFHLSETGNDKDYLASRVAHLLDLNGPAIAVQTSCSTGLVAIAQAAQAIRAGQCEMALAGASSLMFPRGGYMHVAGHVNSASGHCRTFDAAADGTILGDGVGAVLLRPLDEARASGDRVLAVIKGFAVNNDGALRAGYSAPGVRGQVEVISEALAHADVDPETIGYVEAHGTATTVGDPIEVRALSEAWRQHTDASQVAVIGSIKPNIGHANIAAGVAGFMKVVLMLQHRQIPPQINFQTENPDLRLAESPFRIAAEPEDWPPPETGPRMGAVSSFGIGGTNAHMILAEAPQRPAALPQPPMTDIIPLSARSPSALTHLRESVADHLQATQARFTDVAATCQLGRQQMPYRAAVVAPDNTSVCTALTAWRPGPDRRSNGAGVVFLFPGQGAQHAEMGVSLLRDSPTFAKEFDRIAALFAPHIKYDLSDLADNATASRLLATADGLQPALFAVEYALARSLIKLGIQPIAMVGHSLGAYVATTLAGLLSLEDAVRLVAERSKAMEAAPEGAMAVVEADCDTAASLIRDFANVSIAAVNSRDEVVVSGPPQAISEIRKRAAARNITVHNLTVARAFHSPMMQGAANTIAGVALTSAPELHDHGPRVACNVTGDWMTTTLARDPAYWAEHALAPVQFDGNLMAALALQPAVVMEVGPSQSLRRLVRKATGTRIDIPAYTSTMRHPRDERQTDWDTLCHALAQTWQCGIDLDWAAFRNDRPPVQRVPLPTYPFERKRCWPDHDASTTRGHARRLSGDDERRALPWTDRFYTQSQQRVTAARPHRQNSSLSAQRWLILADRAQQDDVQFAVITSLEAQCDTTILDVGELSDGAPRRLTDALTGFVQCDGDRRILLTSTLTLGNDDLTPNSGSALAAPMGVIKALAHVQSSHPIQVWSLTRGGMAVSGEAICPIASMVGGPLTVLSQENPMIETRQIDLPFRNPTDDQTDFVSAVVDECTPQAPRREAAIAIRPNGRWAVRYSQLKLSDDQRAIGRSRLEVGPHIITGGSGRIGLTLARHLIGLGADVYLVSRSSLPPRKDWPSIIADPDVAPEIRQRLESLVAIDAGPGHLTLVQGDVSEPGHMTNLLCNVADRHGRLGSIFHA